MAAIDILIGSLMNYAGFKPEDLQKAVKYAQSEFADFKGRAENSERAIEDLGRRLASVETLLRQLVAALAGISAAGNGAEPELLSHSDAGAGGDGNQSPGIVN